jgi:hypothetical protein
MRHAALLSVAALALAACSPDSTTTAPRSATPGAPNLASVHLKGGASARPSFTDNGLTLTASGSLSGLGNGDVVIELLATANAVATCTNPGTGEHQPAGQNPAPVQISGSQSIPASEIKNGNLQFSVTTLVPASAGPRPAARGECPNVKWTYQVTDLIFTSATINVYQPSLVFTATYNL